MGNASPKSSLNRCDDVEHIQTKIQVVNETMATSEFLVEAKEKIVEMKSEKLCRKFISSAHIAFKFLAKQF